MHACTYTNVHVLAVVKTYQYLASLLHFIPHVDMYVPGAMGAYWCTNTFYAVSYVCKYICRQL